MGKPLRVLIAEDSEDDCQLSVLELQRAGFALTYQRVDTSERMREALARNNWDVIIADYDMPSFTGFDALDLVRGQGLDVPFLIVSGNTTDDIAASALTAGASDCISKHNLSRLVPAVKRALSEGEIGGEKKQI
jgi:phosphoserine phosphatase RsbU/P